MHRLFPTFSFADVVKFVARHGFIANDRTQNSDECVACGGTGKLLCCDGCTRSYHFTCLEPPTDVVPDGEWLCEVCRPRLAPMAFATASLPPTVFAPLTSSISRKNPAAFNLPLGLRGFFEDVVTGDDGEYEEAVPSKAK